MKNKKYIISIIFGIIISFILSFIIYNFNIIRYSKNNKDIDLTSSIVKMDNTTLENGSYILNENSTLSFNYKGYINKLVIYYETDHNVDYSISYNGLDEYSNYSSYKNSDSLNKNINKAYLKIGKNVSSFDISFDTKNPITIKNIYASNKISFNIYLFLLIFVCYFVFLTIYFYCKKSLFNGKIEYLFLTIAISFGLLMIIFQPTANNYSWDDQIHYKITYQVFELDGKTEWEEAIYLIGTRGVFKNINTYEEHFLQNEVVNSASKIVYVTDNSPFIQYNQVGYLAPGLVLKLSRIIHLPVVLGFRLSKVAILLVYCLLAFLAIKIIPRGKILLATISLLPSSLFLASEYSYDPPIIAGIILYVASFINVLENKNQKVDFKTCLILILSILISSFIKAVYIPLILLLLFIPKEKFKNEDEFKHFKLGVILIFVLMMGTFVFPTVANPSSYTDLRGGNTSVSEQLKNILHHPFGYLEILKNNAFANFFERLFGEATLYNFGYLQSGKFHSIVYFLVLITLIFTATVDTYKKDITKKDKILKIVSLILILGIIVLIWTALYLAYTPVLEKTISGVQNRYFLPLLAPIGILIFSNNKIKINTKKENLESLVMTILSIALLISIYEVFYLGFCL